MVGDDEKRNLLSYTYDANMAREIYHELKECYVNLLEALDHSMDGRLLNL